MDVLTGVVYDGDREIELHRDIASIPVLLREGGILPLAADDERDAAGNPERLEVLVAVGRDGAFTLVEDDGTGTGTTPQSIRTARALISWRQDDGVLTIGPVEGDRGAVPARRDWTITFVALGCTAEVRVDGEPVAARRTGGDLSVRLPDARTDRRITATLGGGATLATAGIADRLFAVLHAAQWGHEQKDAAWTVLESGLPVPAQLAALTAQQVPAPLLGALTELLSAR